MDSLWAVDGIYGDCCLMARIYLLASVLYVDDGDWLHTTDKPTDSDEDLISKVQNATTDFGKLAQATGGALKQEKCSAYFLFHKFPAGVPRLKSIRELPPPIAEVTRKDGATAPAHITIPQPDGGELPIATLDVTTPAKMLGSSFVRVVIASLTSLRCKKGLD